MNRKHSSEMKQAFLYNEAYTVEERNCLPVSFSFQLKQKIPEKKRDLIDSHYLHFV